MSERPLPPVPGKRGAPASSLKPGTTPLPGDRRAPDPLHRRGARNSASELTRPSPPPRRPGAGCTSPGRVGTASPGGAVDDDGRPKFPRRGRLNPRGMQSQPTISRRPTSPAPPVGSAPGNGAASCGGARPSEESRVRRRGQTEAPSPQQRLKSSSTASAYSSNRHHAMPFSMTQGSSSSVPMVLTSQSGRKRTLSPRGGASRGEGEPSSASTAPMAASTSSYRRSVMLASRSMTLCPKRLSSGSFLTPVDRSAFSDDEKEYTAHIRDFINNIQKTKVRLSLLTRLFPELSNGVIGGYSPMKIVSLQPPGGLVAKRKIRGPGRPASTTVKRLSMARPGSRKLTFADLPFYDEEDEETGELLTVMEHGMQVVKAGTVDKLIIRLTYEKHPDPGYLSAFMLTYTSFTTPDYLLTKLMERFSLQPPPGSDKDFIDLFVRKKQRPVQIRTVSAIKYFLDHNWKDIRNDMRLVKQLLTWVKGELRSTANYESASYNLEKLLSTNITGVKQKGQLCRVERAPPPFLPRTDRFMDFEPIEVARQLTMLEFANWAEIRPSECQNQAWNSSRRDELSPNIGKMIKRSNELPQCIASQILTRTEMKLRLRVKLIRMWIHVAEECRQLNNFNGVMEIIAGLQLASVYRLKKTWEQVFKTKSGEVFQELKELLKATQNWKRYREELKRCNPPVIPYLGMYLTDLTFIDDGHKDVTVHEGRELINFTKRRQQAVVIRDVQQYQQKAYHFVSVPNIRDFFENLHGLGEEELFRISLEAEPRE